MMERFDSKWNRRLYRLRQDLSVMRRLFPWRITLGLLLMVGVMARVFQVIYVHDLDEPLNYIQAIYAVLNMIFFQLAYTDLPDDPNLAPFFVLAPILGLAMFSLAGFNILHLLRVFFVRRERGQRWQEALASTYYDHVVVCGLGSIGYRVVRHLVDFGQPVVGIELTHTELADELIDADLPVILGDIRSRDVLEKAGADRAKTVVVCTNQDMANIEAAFQIIELNPWARLVLRIFEDDTAQSVQAGFDVDAVLSRSAIAAAAFAYAAVGADVLESFQLGESNYVLAQVPLPEGASLIGCSVGEVAQDQDVTVVFLCRDGKLIDEPSPDTLLQPEDDLYVFAASDRLIKVVHRSFQDGPGGDQANEPHVIVCGLGHTGYRIASALQTLGYSVTALEQVSSRLGQRLAREGVSVHVADFNRRVALTQAGIGQAQAIVACSDDDMLNLETALRARELAPDVRIVIRAFEEELGERLSQAFGIDAVYSTSALAAPAFVQAVLNLHLAQAVTIGDEELALARLKIESGSRLIGQTIDALNAQDELTIVLYARHDRVDLPPDPDTHLQTGDELVLLASSERLRQLHSARMARESWL